MLGVFFWLLFDKRNKLAQSKASSAYSYAKSDSSSFNKLLKTFHTSSFENKEFDSSYSLLVRLMKDTKSNNPDLYEEVKTEMGFNSDKEVSDLFRDVGKLWFTRNMEKAYFTYVTVVFGETDETSSVDIDEYSSSVFVVPTYTYKLPNNLDEFFALLKFSMLAFGSEFVYASRLFSGVFIDFSDRKDEHPTQTNLLKPLSDEENIYLVRSFCRLAGAGVTSNYKPVKFSNAILSDRKFRRIEIKVDPANLIDGSTIKFNSLKTFSKFLLKTT